MNTFYSNSDQTSISLISALNHSAYGCQWNTSTLGTIKHYCTRREYAFWFFFFFFNFDHLYFWTLVYDLEKKRRTVDLCLISACHFHEQSRIIKWKYLESIKLTSFFVACCRKWVPEEKPLEHWLMYCFFFSICWLKSCIFLCYFTHFRKCTVQMSTIPLLWCFHQDVNRNFVFHSVGSCA